MDRCAMFVDAGYVYASGGKLCCNTRSRQEIKLDPLPLLQHLLALATAETQVPVLRTYWYDGARDGIRTTEQRAIAALPDVKLRLGRLNGKNQQKGVDALIYRDMITLSQQRAVSDIVLVSGDEDLREGVRAAQDYGVRVVLIGIAADKGFNQSKELIYEADRIVISQKHELLPSFSLLPQGQAAPVISQSRDATDLSAGPVPVDGVSESATEFANNWIAAATESEILELKNDRPRIPRPLDVELRAFVEDKTGFALLGNEPLRRQARAAWWAAIGD